MRQRVTIHIDQVSVDGATGADRGALAAAIERELARRLSAPAVVKALTSRHEPVIDGGAIDGRDLAGAVASRIGTLATGGGRT